MQRIICGYQRFQDLLLVEPNSDILYDSQMVYMSVFDECKKDGIIDDEELLTWMYEKNLWNQTKEHEMMVSIPKLIEDVKIDLYNNSYDELKTIQLRNNLNQLKKCLLELYHERHKYDYTTSNGIANFMKSYNIIENSVQKYKTRESYDWSTHTVLSLMAYKEKNTVTDEQIRSIAKYSDWKGIWYASKSNGNIFNRTSVDLTSEQKRLIFWSSFYDNLGEHPECPPDKILDDDDMIDGWVAIQRRKKEKEKTDNDTQKKIGNSKIRNSSEIFLVARDEKHAQDIESLNSPQAAAMKQARLNQIKRNKEMKDSDFHDVKAKMMMDAVNKGNEIMRGNK